MIRREEGLVTLYNRVKDARVVLGLSAFKRTPTLPVNEDKLPCIFMVEGVDEIIKYSARSQAGYPVDRVLEVTFEMVTNRDVDIKTLYREVRSVLFAGGIIVADDNTFIREIRTEGPTGYGLPDVTGMRLVLALRYVDKGI